MRPPRTVMLLLAGALVAASPATAAAPGQAAGTGPPCAASPPPGGGEARKALDVARQAKAEQHLNSVLVRVTRDGEEVLTAALGQSMTGVPARPAMHFRAGSVAIVYLGIVLLQLVDERKARLDDPLSRWLPDAPHAREITLRMLGASTSGLRDYVTDPKFLAALEAAPFRHWTPEELLAYPAAHPLWYEPSTGWSYSHANFVLLGAALEKISGTPLDELLRQRVMDPLGLAATRDRSTPEIPQPVLHAFTKERGPYEESTFWNPSWTTAPGAVLTTHICDLARSAEAVGTGELLSPAAFRTQLDPGTVGLGGGTKTCPATVCLKNTDAEHFGLGVLVMNGWILTNPSFSGYAAVQAYLPAERLAIAVATTKGKDTPEGNTAQTIMNGIAEALAPGHPAPGGG
ncbi:beta-lactamase family protein [Streptomyces sp. ICN441]|uniref:serine hydrolase domain-containing protein n=1 Tax=Streptomyces sp. ICN441 TaxID=2558286 RepID=UPI001F0DDC46|nr:beta-lactamase family protein [Streptomyces sp. ICN441]